MPVASKRRHPVEELFRLLSVQNAPHADHSRGSEHVGEDGVQPVSGGVEQLAEPVLLAGERAPQPGCVARQRTDPPVFATGNVGRMEGALLCDSGEPVCIVPVGLAAPHAPDFMSVADGDVDACIQKGVVGSHPVDARALHEDLLDAERTEEFDKGLQSLLEEGVELGPHELAPERVGAYGDNGGHDGKRLVDVYACGSGIQIDDGF